MRSLNCLKRKVFQMAHNMEEFISHLIASSSSFIGGRTLIPGPIAAPSRARGPVVLSSLDPVGTSTRHHQHGAGSTHPQAFAPHNSNIMPSSSSAASVSSTSILRTDMSPMIAWLASQNNSQESQALGASAGGQASEAYTSEDYRKRIPKRYNELTERDCAGVVAQAIRSVVLHTLNDDFRQQCFYKLGASNSREVEREVKSRLISIIAQEEQQTQSDTENVEMDLS